MTSTLVVYLNEQKAGTLTDLGNAQISFEYHPGYLELGGVAISISLPLSAMPFTDAQARPFFSGLLPDDQQLEGLAQHLKVSRRNVFKLLSEVGGECAGAVSLFASESLALGTNTKPQPPLSDDELSQRLNTAKHRPLLGADDSVRLSLAGAQSKLAVVINGGNTFLSTPSSPSTHIIKPASNTLENLVENELICMSLAKAVGFDVPNIELREVGDQRVYQTQRYDRTKSQGIINRDHQEDFCQALGIVPENKYQAEGGPSVDDCIKLIQRVSSRPAVDYQKLLERIVFNYLIGNNDAHAKNFSLIYSNGQCRLAPAYDLVSTAVYPQLNANMAMKIGGRKSANDLQLRHWLSLVPNMETSKRSFRTLVINLCRDVELVLDEKAVDLQAYEVGKKIIDVLLRRIDSLKTLFGAK